MVPIDGFELLYVWFRIEHGRRRGLHIDVTAYLIAGRDIQHQREASICEMPARYLVHGNDSIFSDRVGRSFKEPGVDERSTGRAFPW